MKGTLIAFASAFYVSYYLEGVASEGGNLRIGPVSVSERRNRLTQ